MSKVEEYIEQHTRWASNRIIHSEEGTFTDIPTMNECHSWITPKEAREVTRIAKEETIEEIEKYLNEHYLIKLKYPLRWISVREVIKDFKKTIKSYD